MMRDDRPHVQTALQQAGHLVPSLEHLPAIDALDGEPLEYHLIPIDRHVLGGNTEHGDAAAVMQRA